MKIVTVVGARPQFIKAAQISSAAAQIGQIQEILVHTGQHYDYKLSGIFFEQLKIALPSYHLGVGSGPHGLQTGAMLGRIEEVLLRERPALVLVYGDTNSTLAGALASAKLHIPVAHVEAGLRSFNRRMPEEVNRIITDSISDLLFAPTSTAVNNLLREGCSPDKVIDVGDVMYDAALNLSGQFNAEQLLDSLGLRTGQYVLVTIHRAENTDNSNRLGCIVDALREASRAIPMIFPMHPRTLTAMQAADYIKRLGPKVKVVEPVGYLEMLALERHAKVIVTDSGGVQKEAFFFRVPCITLRTETEWVELVESGWNRLISSNEPDELSHTLAIAISTAGPGRSDIDLYGGGTASKRIVEHIVRCFAS